MIVRLKVKTIPELLRLPDLQLNAVGDLIYNCDTHTVVFPNSCLGICGTEVIADAGDVAGYDYRISEGPYAGLCLSAAWVEAAGLCLSAAWVEAAGVDWEALGPWTKGRLDTGEHVYVVKVLDVPPRVP